jgi:hypothetical protein
MNNRKFKKPRPLCIHCNQEETVLVRLSEEGELSDRKTSICTNPECSFKINLDKVEGWVEK